jgi:hypothetical protein
MRPDREAFKTHVAALSQKRVRERKPELQAVRRAALSVDAMTGDENWDHFLSQVQERMEGAQKELDQAVEALKNSNDFSPEPLIMQKLAVRLWGREVEALQWVIGLPRQLQEQGDRASELLGTIDESSN